MHEDSDIEVLQPNQANRRRGPSIQRQGRRLVRTDNNPDFDGDDSGDAEMDEDDESFGSASEDDNSDGDDESETQNNLIKASQQIQSQRQQYHAFDLDDDENDEQSKS